MAPKADANTLERIGPGRCFPFWQEVLACYVVNASTDDDSGKKKCAPVLEDYYECLHHKKEVSFDTIPRLALLRIYYILYIYCIYKLEQSNDRPNY